VPVGTWDAKGSSSIHNVFRVQLRIDVLEISEFIVERRSFVV